MLSSSSYLFQSWAAFDAVFDAVVDTVVFPIDVTCASSAEEGETRTMDVGTKTLESGPVEPCRRGVGVGVLVFFVPQLLGH